MSICIALGMMLGRSIQTIYIDIKKKRDAKQQQKREKQRLSEESARFQSFIQSEYQHLGGHEYPGGEVLRVGRTDYHDGRNNSFAHRTVIPSALQTPDWLNTEVLEDTPPMYDHNAPRLPPYDHDTPPNLTAGFPRRGRRRQREGSRRHDENNLTARNGEQINEPQPRARACTGMRIREHQGAVIWYDTLEDRYEVISRSLAPATESPLPPPYMPNCVEGLFI